METDEKGGTEVQKDVCALLATAVAKLEKNVGHIGVVKDQVPMGNLESDAMKGPSGHQRLRRDAQYEEENFINNTILDHTESPKSGARRKLDVGVRGRERGYCARVKNVACNLVHKKEGLIAG